MIITPEQAALKARERFDALLNLVQQAHQDGQRIDTVERELMRHLLALGLDLLTAFVAHHGDGDQGPEVQTTDGQAARRLPERQDRRYVSIFGELSITRVVYGTRQGQKIQRVPLDERLGLPEGDFSYVLEDWSQRFCLKESFAEAGRSLEMRRPEPEGPKPHRRRGKGEKANKKQMACIGAVYSIEPFVRKADDILDEVLRDQRSKDRPEPQHKHVWAEMIRVIEGQPPVTAKDGLFCQLCDELTVRNLGQDRPVVCLMDGERSLWDAQAAYFPEAVGVLDLFHVLERVWGVAHCFHKEGSDEAEQYVEERLRELLEGRVGSVIEGFRHRMTQERLRGTKRKVVKSAIEYLENNREHLKYDEYLAAGYPIGSGVAEGACRHLVKDRLEQTGMRWTVDGAQAMLHVRALYLNDQWDDFLEFRVEQEQDRLYQRDAA